MAIIDPKTSKRFVTGMLKTESSRMVDCLNETEANRQKRFNSNLRSSDKPSAMAKRLEENYKKNLGNTYLYSYWEGRLFNAFSLTVINPEERSPYIELGAHTINTRSTMQNLYILGTITTHSMERLLQRRSDTKLLALLKEELNNLFLSDYLELIFNYENGTVEGNEFKVNTATGIMCIRMPKENLPPVFTTWYSQ